MFSKELTFAGHTRTFQVDSLLSEGWEVRVLADTDVVRRHFYTDWHRVERTISAFEREVAQLLSQGWRLVSASENVQSTNR
jgi:hypothetical protein